MKCLAIIAVAALLYGCGQSADESGRLKNSETCKNIICKGDAIPNYDPSTEMAFKRNSVIYVVPKIYGGADGHVGFMWPSKLPINAAPENPMPNKAPSESTQDGQPYYDSAIEVFVETASNSLQWKSPYEHLAAEKSNGRLITIDPLNQQLERWRIAGVEGDRDIDWLIAINQKDMNGYPPVIGCLKTSGRCGARFHWKTDLVVYVRFSDKNSMSWPDIYREVERVLSQIREA